MLLEDFADSYTSLGIACWVQVAMKISRRDCNANLVRVFLDKKYRQLCSCFICDHQVSMITVIVMIG